MRSARLLPRVAPADVWSISVYQDRHLVGWLFAGQPHLLKVAVVQDR